MCNKNGYGYEGKVTCFAFDFLHTKRIAENVVSGPITTLAAAMQDYNFWEVHIRPLRRMRGGSART